MPQKKIENAYYREMAEKQMHEDFLTGDKGPEHVHLYYWSFYDDEKPKCETCDVVMEDEEMMRRVNAMEYANAVFTQIDQNVNEVCMCFDDPLGREMLCPYHAFKDAATK
jgi:hypothetical protein